MTREILSSHDWSLKSRLTCLQAGMIQMIATVVVVILVLLFLILAGAGVFVS